MAKKWDAEGAFLKKKIMEYQTKYDANICMPKVWLCDKVIKMPVLTEWYNCKNYGVEIGLIANKTLAPKIVSDSSHQGRGNFEDPSPHPYIRNLEKL